MRNTLTKWSGASVILFPNNGIPDIYGKAISVHPATETKISISKQVVKSNFNKEPYISKCTDVWESGNLFDSQPYTFAHCVDAKIQTLTYEACSCLLSHGYMNGQLEMDPTKTKWCGPQDQECVRETATQAAEKGMMKGACKPRCNDELFMVFLTRNLHYFLLRKKDTFCS